MNSKGYTVVIFFLVAILSIGKLYSQNLPEVSIPNFPPGKTFVVKYDVIINDPLPKGMKEISNQVLIKKANIVDVVSDDPGTETQGDSTIIAVVTNSPPTIVGIRPAQVLPDNTSIAPFADVSINDTDLPAQDLVVTVSVDSTTEGSFTTLGDFIDEGEGVYKFKGTALAATAAIKNLVFAPKKDRLPPGFSDNIAFTIVVIDGAGESVRDVGTTLVVTSIDDATVFLNDDEPRVVDDNKSVFPFDGVSLTDPDIQPLWAEIEILDGLSRGDFKSESVVNWRRTAQGQNIVYRRLFDDKTKNCDDVEASIRSVIFVPRSNAIAPLMTETTSFRIAVAQDLDVLKNTLTVSTLTTSVNDPPVITGEVTTHVAIVERLARVTTIHAEDQDFSQLITYSIVGGGDAKMFQIDSSSGDLSFVVAPDFENPTDANVDNTYEVIVRASDGIDFDEQSLYILISNINDSPPLIVRGQSFRVDENASDGTPIGAPLARDQDEIYPTFRHWKIIAGNVGDAFFIHPSSGQLTVNKGLVLDAERLASLTLTLTLSDGLNISNPETVDILINNINDVTPIIAGNQTFNVDENSSVGAFVGKVTASDGDATTTTFQDWKITDGNTANLFAIDPSTGELRVNDEGLDYELVSSYSLMVQVSDGENTSLPKIVSVRLEDRNDVAPVISKNQNFKVDENAREGFSVGKVLASDGDSKTSFRGWTILSGNIDNAFAIHTVTGELTVNSKNSLDFEQRAEYSLALTVSDGQNSSEVEKVTVALNDVNDVAPVVVIDQVFTIGENAERGTNVGTVSASDGDASAGSLQDWTITGGNTRNAFAIIASTGVLIVNDAELDFETKDTYELLVQVSDGIHTSSPIKVTIRIQDKPEAITNIIYSSETLYENQPPGASAGNLTSISDDHHASFTYNLVAGQGDTDNYLFSILDNEIRTKEKLNFEQKSIYTIRVRSFSQDGLSFEKQLFISIKDLNERPTLDPITDQFICNTLGQQIIVLSGLSAGEDSSQSVSVSISNSNENLFERLLVVGNELRYSIRPLADGDATITLIISDDGGNENGEDGRITRSFKIFVNSPPSVTILSDRGTHFAKGLEAKLTASGGVSYQWMDAHGIISGHNTSSLTIRPFETTTYRVKVTNIKGCSSEQQLTINVNDNYRIFETNNIISPNGDGVNDMFKIVNLDAYPNSEVRIYDRAGRMLYKKRNYTNDWDGTFEGAPLAEDTYFYLIDFGPNITPIKGFITVIRD